MKKYKPFATANVPSLYHLLMSNPKFIKLDHSALKICISAAASFPEDSQKKLEAIIGHGKLIEAYGMTETAPLTVMNPTWGEKKLGYIGLPLPNTTIKLLDPSTGREVPCGEPGEMCVKGPQVMAGYYKQPEETAKAVDSDGFMHSGDIAVQDEAGYLKIVDRTKDMVNVSGYKVFSIKVEDILAEHPAVGEIAIIGIPDIDRPGSELVAACVKVRDGYQYDGDEKSLKENMASFARERLAAYEIPKIIEFRKEMPLTSVGKLNKKKLREDFSS
jgi:long-chain acyl-CoA synthetase